MTTHAALAGINRRHRLNPIAWLTIVTQVAFPLAVAFTPSMAGAGSETLTRGGAVSPTTTYTLGPLETPASVAARYGMSVDELKKLNQFRTFARGFDNLRQGDEIDVPRAPLSMADRAATLSAPVRENGTEARVAGLAQQTGSFLANEPHRDGAASLARGMATGAATSAVNDWLGQFGTARVTLNTDKNLSLKGSQLDLLLPWYDTQDHLLFTQHSIHRTDDRNQLNTGAGWRHFTPADMTGVNLFLDHDLTRYHSRAGVGIEYWRDNLKLGGNAYVGLTGWRSAPELDHDYEARPANGWDVRAEGYLPAYPQLGAKLMYEQYYGDEVALFGKDKRQKDPQAFTAGVSYTPFPLLSLSAEQRQGAQGENDTRFGVSLTWQPGVSLSKQMDPSAVAARRSLAGSRHDLVERNNNIVLEYRKKELIRLSLHDPVTGRPGEQRALVASLQTTHSLKQLDVDAGALVLAGGNVQVNGGQVTATLPTYRYTPTPGIDNSYRVAVTASDVRGNTSNRELTTVVVQAPQVDPASSAVTAEPTTLLADGSSTSQLTYTAKDNGGNAILALPVTLRLGGDAGESVTVSGVRDNGDGSYSATLTSGTQPGTVTVMPQVNGQDMARTAVSLTLTSQSTDPAHSAIALTAVTARNTAVTARNTAVFRSGDTVQVTVTLKDEQDNPVSGLAAMLTATSVTVPGMSPESGQWQDHSDGTYTATYIATTVGEGQQALLQLSGWQTSVVSDAFTITVGDLAPANSGVSVSPDSIVANGSDSTTVTFSAKDAHDNPVSGLTGLTLTVADVDDTRFVGFADEGNGTYTGTLTGGTTAGGTATLMPQWNGVDAAQRAATLTMTEAPVAITGAQVKGTTDGHVFAADSGFPQTAFSGATFQLQFNGATPAAGAYTFTSNASWVTVTDRGEVAFTDNGVTGSQVTITAAPVVGGDNLTYSFVLDQWITFGATAVSQVDAIAYCAAEGGTLATVDEVNMVVGSVPTNKLFGTWHPNGGIPQTHYWAGPYQGPYNAKYFTSNGNPGVHLPWVVAPMADASLFRVPLCVH